MLVVLATAGLLVTSPASARPPDAAMPSRSQVEAARARSAATARDVGAVEAELLLAEQEVTAAAVAAEQASEAYNGARWRLAQAREAYGAARAEAVRARGVVAGQRDRVAALVAQSYQQGDELSALSAVVGADGPDGVLDRLAGLQGASTSLAADYRRFAATDTLAEVYESQAREARAEQTRLAAAAERARLEAATAVTAAHERAASVAARRTVLVRELARVQNISVSLARTRQRALERAARERTQERAEERAQKQAQERERRAAARARAATGADAGAPAGRAGSGSAVPQRPAPRAASPRPPSPRPATPGPPARPAPEPVDPEPAPRPPSPSRGAQQAIRFAEAQLGEPYQWGAAGPDSWDCSGLTMAAWASAGRSLPHYSVAQYDAGTPIPVSSARPGDLLFWSSNGRPSGIHHVALSLGGAEFIEAPRTGLDVRRNTVHAWYPTFAVRL